MATTKQNWAEIDDEHEEDATEETNEAGGEENKDSSSRPTQFRKPVEKKIQKFPTKPELITAIKEREEPFVQLYICKANYNAQIKDVLEVLQERSIEHGFVKKIKDGLFVIDFDSHDKAISFIKQTPKILDRPYFVKISNYNKDYTGWQTQGQRPNNQKGQYKKTFDNNKAPRNPKNYENRKEKYQTHQDDGEDHGAPGSNAEEGVKHTPKPYEGKSNRYEGFNKERKEHTSHISRGPEAGGEEQKEFVPHAHAPQHEGERHITSTNNTSEDAPPPGVNVHQKREYNNQNKYPKKTDEPEDPNKPKEQYKPQGFSSGATHKKSDDHHEIKAAAIFGEAKGVIPKEIASSVVKVAPVNIAKDLPISTTAPTAPAPVATPAPPAATTAPPKQEAKPVQAPVKKEEAQVETKKPSAPAPAPPAPAKTEEAPQPAPRSEPQRENNKPKKEEAPVEEEWITVPKENKKQQQK